MSSVPLKEKEIIARIRAQVKPGAKSRVVTGIGDDCAVLQVPEGHQALVTTDFSIEGVHFRREWHPADAVGHRCLTRGLSDIAAMGGEPISAFLSLALPKELPQRWVDDFFGGLLRLAKTTGVTLSGGDIAESRAGVLADITVVGSVPEGKAITRSGAQAGDHLFVTGELGGPSAMLRRMMQNPNTRFRTSDCPTHFYPEPQLKVGRYLRDKGIATAMIDISDGLSTDLAHLCEESRVRAELQADTIPLGSVGRHEVPIEFALHGGDEYQLLFTAPANKRVPAEIAGVPVSHIGYIERPSKDMPQMLVCFGGADKDIGYELEPQGWEHFGSK